jgi:hypothetical protein
MESTKKVKKHDFFTKIQGKKRGGLAFPADLGKIHLGETSMSYSILAENEGKRLSFSLPWLCCFAMFTAWQIGVFSYSGAALMVEGRLPLGIDEGNFTPLISLGYILSIA